LQADFIEKYAGLDSFLHRREPRAKIICALGLIIILLTTSPTAYFALSGYGLLLLAVMIASRVPLGYYLRRAGVILPFVIMVAIFIPFRRAAGTDDALDIMGITVSRQGLLIFWNVVIKALLAILILLVFSTTTSFARQLEGLAGLKVPAILVMVAGFAYRYLFVLVEEMLRMKRACDSRGYHGRWLGQVKTIGQIIGTLFLRSYQRAERIYQAMVARGYEGGVYPGAVERLKRADYLFMIASVGLFLTLRIIDR